MNHTVVLASGSPQRLKLLQQVGIDPVVIPPDVDETPLVGEQAAELVERLAEAKALKVAQEHPTSIVIAADSVVSVGGQILGKPSDSADATKMLGSLSGTTQQVFTGHCIVAEGKAELFVGRTDVEFRELTEAEVIAYVASGEHIGKAGACSIQGYGSTFVKSIDGSYSNVVGLDVSWTIEQLLKLGVDYLDSWPRS